MSIQQEKKQDNHFSDFRKRIIERWAMSRDQSEFNEVHDDKFDEIMRDQIAHLCGVGSQYKEFNKAEEQKKDVAFYQILKALQFPADLNIFKKIENNFNFIQSHGYKCLKIDIEKNNPFTDPDKGRDFTYDLNALNILMTCDNTYHYFVYPIIIHGQLLGIVFCASSFFQMNPINNNSINLPSECKGEQNTLLTRQTLSKSLLQDIGTKTAGIHHSWVLLYSSKEKCYYLSYPEIAIKQILDNKPELDNQEVAISLGFQKGVLRHTPRDVSDERITHFEGNDLDSANILIAIEEFKRSFEISNTLSVLKSIQKKIVDLYKPDADICFEDILHEACKDLFRYRNFYLFTKLKQCSEFHQANASESQQAGDIIGKIKDSTKYNGLFQDVTDELGNGYATMIKNIPVTSKHGKVQRLQGEGDLCFLVQFDEPYYIVKEHFADFALMLDWVYSAAIESAISWYESMEAKRNVFMTAIIAQNLSHNIGSHALSDPKLFEFNKYEEDAVKEVANNIRCFHRYLQARMDYVNQLIYDGTPHSEPMYFFEDLIKGFIEQSLLINRLISDRGFNGSDITFTVRYLNLDVTYKWNGEFKKFIKSNRVSTDPVIAIPCGMVGRHALYSILENILRNSAKYGKKTDADDIEVKFTLKEPANNTDYWLLTISDTKSYFENNERDKSDFKTLQDKFYNNIDTGFSTPKPGNGLVEIREGIHYLYPISKPSKEDIFLSLKNYGNLTFRLRLQSPELLVIINTKDNSWKNYAQGFYNLNDISEALQIRPFIMLILDDEEDNSFKQLKEFLQDEKNHEWMFPFRFLFLCKSQKRKEDLMDSVLHSPGLEDVNIDKISFRQKNRLKIIDNNALHSRLKHLKSKDANFELFNEVYLAWLKAYKPIEDNNPWRMLIKFEKNDDINEIFKNETLECFNDYLILDVTHEDINEDYDVVFAKHGQCTRNERARFYQPFGGNLTPLTFSAFSNPPNDKDQFKFFVLNTLESSLTTIVCFDERVYQILKDSNNEISVDAVRNLSKSYVFLLAKLMGETEAIAFKPEISNDANPENSIGILSVRENESDRTGQTPEVAYVKDVNDVDYDICIVHEGLVEELIKSNASEKEENNNFGCEKHLFSQFSWVIRTSGKNEDIRVLNHRLPFCASSSINGFINTADSIEKIKLSQILLNS